MNENPIYTDPATGRLYRVDPQTGQSVWVDGPPQTAMQAPQGFQQANTVHEMPSPQAFYQGEPPKPPRPWFKKKRFMIPIGLFALMGLSSQFAGGSASTEAVAVKATSSPSASASAAPEASAAAPEEAKESGTKSQQNALRSAENYLKFKGFSEKGLIEQLSSEYGDQFSEADATWAVNQLDVDWNEQAVRAGQSYLDLKGFSRAGLIDQLSSEYGDQFTKAQATYAVDQLGL